jgi:hypothetical protein
VLHANFGESALQLENNTRLIALSRYLDEHFTAGIMQEN